MLTFSLLQFALWIALAFVLGGLVGAVNVYFSAWRVVRKERRRAPEWKTIAHGANYGMNTEYHERVKATHRPSAQTNCLCTTCRQRRREAILKQENDDE